MEYLNLILFRITDLYQSLTITHLMIINVITLLIVIILVIFILSQKPTHNNQSIIKEYQSIIEDDADEVDLDRITQAIESKKEETPTLTFEEEQEHSAIISYEDLMKNASTPTTDEVEDIPLTKVELPSSNKSENTTTDALDHRETIKQLFNEPTTIKQTNEVKHEEFLANLKSLKTRLK